MKDNEEATVVTAPLRPRWREGWVAHGHCCAALIWWVLWGALDVPQLKTKGTSVKDLFGHEEDLRMGIASSLPTAPQLLVGPHNTDPNLKPFCLCPSPSPTLFIVSLFFLFLFF